MSERNQLYLIGYALGLGGPDRGSADGPLVLEKSPFIADLKNKKLDIHWQSMIRSSEPSRSDVLKSISEQCHALAESVKTLVQEKKFFIVLGGDHTSAIGTWSGASSVQKNLGLIWIDAHLDSHTPETTPTGNIHGMPLACLLGHGKLELTTILKSTPKLKPENVCLIGVRSFEAGEQKLLEELNVRIFYMDEVNERGIDFVMQDALSIATLGTEAYGISIDLDSIDPKDAPATDVAVPGGVSAKDLCRVLQKCAADPHFIGAEIVEFDPHRDRDQITEKLIANLILSLTFK